MKLKIIYRTLLLIPVIFAMNSTNAMCNAKEHKIYSAYDAYLDANPNISDDAARTSFAKKLGITSAKLKDIYFSCLYDTHLGDGAKNRQQPAVGNESKITVGTSCNMVGYKYGLQAAQAIKGSPQSGPGIVVPERCRGLSATTSGITQGTRDGMK